MTDSSPNALALLLSALGVDPEDIEDTLEGTVGTRDLLEGIRRAKVVDEEIGLEEGSP